MVLLTTINDGDAKSNNTNECDNNHHNDDHLQTHRVHSIATHSSTAINGIKQHQHYYHNINNNNTTANLHSSTIATTESMELYAADWIEINRTLAKNSLLVSELTLDLSEKKAMIERCSAHLVQLSTTTTTTTRNNNNNSTQTQPRPQQLFDSRLQQTTSLCNKPSSPQPPPPPPMGLFTFTAATQATTNTSDVSKRCNGSVVSVGGGSSSSTAVLVGTPCSNAIHHNGHHHVDVATITSDAINRPTLRGLTTTTVRHTTIAADSGSAASMIVEQKPPKTMANGAQIVLPTATAAASAVAVTTQVIDASVCRNNHFATTNCNREVVHLQRQQQQWLAPATNCGRCATVATKLVTVPEQCAGTETDNPQRHPHHYRHHQRNSLDANLNLVDQVYCPCLVYNNTNNTDTDTDTTNASASEQSNHLKERPLPPPQPHGYHHCRTEQLGCYLALHDQNQNQIRSSTTCCLANNGIIGGTIQQNADVVDASSLTHKLFDQANQLMDERHGWHTPMYTKNGLNTAAAAAWLSLVAKENVVDVNNSAATVGSQQQQKQQQQQCIITTTSSTGTVGTDIGVYGQQRRCGALLSVTEHSSQYPSWDTTQQLYSLNQLDSDSSTSYHYGCVEQQQPKPQQQQHKYGSVVAAEAAAAERHNGTSIGPPMVLKQSVIESVGQQSVAVNGCINDTTTTSCVRKYAFNSITTTTATNTTDTSSSSSSNIDMNKLVGIGNNNTEKCIQDECHHSDAGEDGDGIMMSGSGKGGGLIHCKSSRKVPTNTTKVATTATTATTTTTTTQDQVNDEHEASQNDKGDALQCSAGNTSVGVVGGGSVIQNYPIIQCGGNGGSASASAGAGCGDACSLRWRQWRLRRSSSSCTSIPQLTAYYRLTTTRSWIESRKCFPLRPLRLRCSFASLYKANWLPFQLSGLAIGNNVHRHCRFAAAASSSCRHRNPFYRFRTKQQSKNINNNYNRHFQSSDNSTRPRPQTLCSLAPSRSLSSSCLSSSLSSSSSCTTTTTITFTSTSSSSLLTSFVSHSSSPFLRWSPVTASLLSSPPPPVHHQHHHCQHNQRQKESNGWWYRAPSTVFIVGSEQFGDCSTSTQLATNDTTTTTTITTLSVSAAKEEEEVSQISSHCYTGIGVAVAAILSSWQQQQPQLVKTDKTKWLLQLLPDREQQHYLSVVFNNTNNNNQCKTSSTVDVVNKDKEKKEHTNSSHQSHWSTLSLSSLLPSYQNLPSFTLECDANSANLQCFTHFWFLVSSSLSSLLSSSLLLLLPANQHFESTTASASASALHQSYCRCCGTCKKTEHDPVIAELFVSPPPPSSLRRCFDSVEHPSLLLSTSGVSTQRCQCSVDDDDEHEHDASSSPPQLALKGSPTPTLTPQSTELEVVELLGHKTVNTASTVVAVASLTSASNNSDRVEYAKIQTKPVVKRSRISIRQRNFCKSRRRRRRKAYFEEACQFVAFSGATSAAAAAVTTTTTKSGIGCCCSSTSNSFFSSQQSRPLSVQRRCCYQKPPPTAFWYRQSVSQRKRQQLHTTGNNTSRKHLSRTVSRNNVDNNGDNSLQYCGSQPLVGAIQTFSSYQTTSPFGTNNCSSSETVTQRSSLYLTQELNLKVSASDGNGKNWCSNGGGAQGVDFNGSQETNIGCSQRAHCQHSQHQSQQRSATSNVFGSSNTTRQCQVQVCDQPGTSVDRCGPRVRSQSSQHRQQCQTKVLVDGFVNGKTLTESNPSCVSYATVVSFGCKVHTATTTTTTTGQQHYSQQSYNSNTKRTCQIVPSNIHSPRQFNCDRLCQLGTIDHSIDHCSSQHGCHNNYYSSSSSSTSSSSFTPQYQSNVSSILGSHHKSAQSTINDLSPNRVKNVQNSFEINNSNSNSQKNKEKQQSSHQQQSLIFIRLRALTQLLLMSNTLKILNLKQFPESPITPIRPQIVSVKSVGLTNNRIDPLSHPNTMPESDSKTSQSNTPPLPEVDNNNMALKKRPQSPTTIIGATASPVKSKPLSIFNRSGFRSNSNASATASAIAAANVTRRSDSPSTITRSSSSAASSSHLTPNFSNSPPSSEYMHHHRPSCPQTILNQDLKKIEILTQQQQQQHSPEFSDPLSLLQSNKSLSESEPDSKMYNLSAARLSMPHPNSTPSLSAMVNYHSCSPPSPPLPDSGAQMIVSSPPATTATSASVSLRRPSNFGRVSASFSSGGTVGKGNQPILKYSKKRLRGPYGEMLESKMRNNDSEADNNTDTIASSNRNSVLGLFTIIGEPRPPLSFTDELLRQTKSQRNRLDQYSQEAMGTASDAEGDFSTSDTSSTEQQQQPTTGEKNVQSSQSNNGNSVEPPTRPTQINLETNNVRSNKVSEEQIFSPTPLVEVYSPGGNIANSTVDEEEDEDEHKKEQSEEETCKISQTDSKETMANNNKPSPTAQASAEMKDSSITAAIGRHLDTRAHIVGEMYDIEKNYCDVLRTLHENYLTRYPNKENAEWIVLVTNRLPSIMEFHCKLLEQLRRRIADWSSEHTKIGDLFDAFVNPHIVEFYENMVNHLIDLKAILNQMYAQQVQTTTKDGSSSKGGGGGGGYGGSAGGGGGGGNASQKGNTATQVNNSGNKHGRLFTPDNLLISTIQRIPRYELLLTRLLKYTNAEHIDYNSLKQAFNIIHDMLIKIGTYQNETPSSECAANTNTLGSQKENCAEISTLTSSAGGQTSSSSSSSVDAVNTNVPQSAPQTILTSPINNQTIQVVDTSSRQLYVRDLEPVIEGAQSLLEQYQPNSLVHIYEYVMIRKKTERAIFVLDDAILLCQVKTKKKSDKFEYNKFKMQQIFKLEQVELRCQCWQHWCHQQQQTPSSQQYDSSKEQYSNIHLVTSSDGSGGGGGGHVGEVAIALGCQSCIELLEHDIKALLKLQHNVQDISNNSIRTSLQTNLTEIMHMVHSQLVEMHETVSRCSKDCNVDLYVLPANLSGTTTTNVSMDTGDAHYLDMCTSSTSTTSAPSTVSSSTHSNHHHLHQQQQMQRSVRLVHYKCPQHQYSTLSGEPEYSFSFTCAKKRSNFETVVTNLRTQLIKSKLKLEFLRAVPYEKTRAGIQFTCATAAMGTNNIWICKSDGFVGQISVLSINDDPSVNSSVGVCNAQIVCITSVPPASIGSGQAHRSYKTPLIETRSVMPINMNNNNTVPPVSISTTSLLTSLGFGRRHTQTVPSSLVTQFPPGDCLDEPDINELESDSVLKAAIGHVHNVAMASVALPPPPVSSIKSTSNLLQHLKPKAIRTKSSASASSNITTSNITSPVSSQCPMSAQQTLSPVSTTTTESLATSETKSNNGVEHSRASSPSSHIAISRDCPTMWFGTDDSTVNIYSCFDAVRIGKNKTKVTLSAKVESIQYFKERVFVGLANQTVAIFTRDATGCWQTTPKIVEGVHCYRFCVVLNECLWTSSLNVIQIRNEEFQTIEGPIHVDELEEISFMVANNQSVFLTSANSSYIYRYTPGPPYQRLGAISIGPFVNKALSMTEDIIRHHKNACLKVSTMHTVQDRIWIGTSAGVILVLDNKNTIEIVPNGHTGHVRFITSAKLKNDQTIVLAGGDGYEHFAPGTGSNLAGQTDLFHFMSYCSNLALNLLGRSSSNTNVASSIASSISMASNSSTSSGSAVAGMNTLTVNSGSGGGSSAGANVSGPRASNLTSSPSSVSGYSTISGSSASTATSGMTCNSDTSHEQDSLITATLPSSSSSFTMEATSASSIAHHHPPSNSGTDDSKSHLLIWRV